MTRKELMRMMPANANDVPAAARIVELGHPAVAPVMRDMVRSMRVAESPVADTFAAFFGSLGEHAVSVVAEGLRRDNCWLKHRIFTRILPEWPPDAVRQLTSRLMMVATHPDPHNNDLRSLALLIQHRLADLEWIKDWIAFKTERLSVRKELLAKIEEQLGSVQ